MPKPILSKIIISTVKNEFLLDKVQGAKVAFSLRKLRKDYNGYAIKVRRSTDNAEKDIGFMSNLLDLGSLLSFVGAGTGYISTWYDQSVNANHASQTTLSAQPIIVSSGVLVTNNNLPTVSFAAANLNVLKTANNIDIVGNSSFSAYMVAAQTLFNGYQGVIGFGAANLGNSIYFGCDSGTGLLYAGFYNGGKTYPNNAPTTAYKIRNFSWDSTQGSSAYTTAAYRVRTNRIADTLTNAMNNVTINITNSPLALGRGGSPTSVQADEFMTGGIAEVILFTSFTTSSVTDEIEKSQSDFFKIY